jgi:peptidoglycan/LPS O-acetylase OafA/YrhL
MFLARPDLPAFWRRRMARIAPSVLTFVGCMALWFGGSMNEVGVQQIAASLTFTSNYFHATPDPAPSALGHLWFVAVVVQGCLLMSFIAWLARREIAEAAYAVGCTAAVFAACTIAYWMLDSDLRFTSMYRMHLDVAAAGMFASCFVAIHWKSANTPRMPFAVPCLLIVAVSANLSFVPPPLQLVVGGAAFALAINLVDRSTSGFRQLLASHLLQKLGAWSFSIYLWQQPFHLLANQGGLDPLSGMVGGLGAGIIAYYLIERPARNYLNQRWAPRPRLTLVHSAAAKEQQDLVTASPLRLVEA